MTAKFKDRATNFLLICVSCAIACFVVLHWSFGAYQLAVQLTINSVLYIGLLCLRYWLFDDYSDPVIELVAPTYAPRQPIIIWDMTAEEFLANATEGEPALSEVNHRRAADDPSTY